MKAPVAHTPNPDGEWHSLEDHLEEVAEHTAKIAEKFDAREAGYWLGALHDIGKYRQEFQDYLRAQHAGRYHPKTPHAIWGAALVYQLIRKQKDHDHWKELALPIHGHHTGLIDAGVLAQRLHVVERDALVTLVHTAQDLIKSLPQISLKLKAGTRREIFIRMLFSTLVDADYLDTERHFKSQESVLRHDAFPDIAELWRIFEADQREFLARVKDKKTRVNQVRQEVYEACLQAAESLPGLFRLTVPTGGGKTRSSIAFALKHACLHDLQRIVVAMPYTSIIDQTAQEYRKIFGESVVLEHHSQVEGTDDEDQDPQKISLRLASENWDAPLIVTTTVQLFESLFANKPSRVRKLHNLARSVIILDEVQTLSPRLLKPTLDVLRALVEDYGTTIVLSTATQPTFENTPYLQELKGMSVQEIVPHYSNHFQALKRVEYEYRRKPLSLKELAEEIHELTQVMVVLNTRKDALALIDELEDDPDTFHLSTLLCGAHRRKVLKEVRNRLDPQEPKPLRLISTQVVEAGVDLDFPVVYRAIGPLDRIVQAAGRCNREGELEFGRVIIFKPVEGGTPRGPYKIGLEKAALLLSEHDPDDLHDPEIYRAYFRRLFTDLNLDKKEIQTVREHLNYPEVARRYRLIEDDTMPIVVDYGDSLKRLDDWRRDPSRQTWQALQPYLVNIYRREAQQYLQDGWLEEVSEGLFKWLGEYDEQRGLKEAVYDPSDLVR